MKIDYEKMKFIKYIMQNSQIQKDGSVLLKIEIDDVKRDVVFNFDGKGYFGYTKKTEE